MALEPGGLDAVMAVAEQPQVNGNSSPQQELHTEETEEEGVATEAPVPVQAQLGKAVEAEAGTEAVLEVPQQLRKRVRSSGSEQADTAKKTKVLFSFLYLQI